MQRADGSVRRPAGSAGVHEAGRGEWVAASTANVPVLRAWDSDSVSDSGETAWHSTGRIGGIGGSASVRALAMRTPAHIWHARRATPPRAQGAEGVRLGAAQTIGARPSKRPRFTPERPPVLPAPSCPSCPSREASASSLKPGILILRPSARVLVYQPTAWTRGRAPVAY